MKPPFWLITIGIFVVKKKRTKTFRDSETDGDSILLEFIQSSSGRAAGYVVIPMFLIKTRAADAPQGQCV